MIQPDGTRRGAPTRTDGPEITTLGDLLPVAHFRERHERRIAAPAPAVWAALHELRLADSPLARMLLDLRTLPARLTGRDQPRMVTDRFLDAGPLPLLAVEPNRTIVAGGVIQPWKLRGGATPPSLDATALRAFDKPGWVKCGVDFVLEADGHATVLSTETRVQATDRGTRVRFGLYWMLIRAGSGLIRRELLRSVARRAEASAAADRCRSGARLGDATAKTHASAASSQERARRRY